jgi:RNA polymerase sigma-70 factor (ECF subfamily)
VVSSDKTARLQIVQFLARYQTMIQGYAYAISRDFHIAEDVYQEVAVIVADRWETLPRDEELGRWLRECTRRKTLEVGRRTRHMPVTMSNEILDQVGTHFRAESAGEARGPDLRDIVAECADKLRGMAQRVVLARYRDNRTCAEIAAELQRSVQSVYSILKRARRALAECIESLRLSGA